MIFNMTGGGKKTEDPMNFQVKAYPSETALKADNPSENTIGVCTTTTISSWAFSATEPTEREVGMVWIEVGNSSPAEFNALKQNALQVYPIMAQQYVGGKWEDKVAYSYQNSEWVPWDVYLLDLITGFTTQREDGSGSVTIDIDNRTVTAIDNAAGGGNANVVYYGEEKIDFTEYKTLSFHVHITGVISTYIGLWSVNTSYSPWNNRLAVKEFYDTTLDLWEEDVTIDISAVNTSCYFGIGMTARENGIKGINTTVISDIKLSK